MKVLLPNGLLDGSDLFNYAVIDELRGKQQDYLVNRELVIGDIGHIPKILADMILSLETKEGLQWKGKMEDAIWKLPEGDISTILIKIRENTYGPRFYHEAVCPHCEHNNKSLRLDLDKLELDVLPLTEMVDSSKKLLKLPKSGEEVELKPLYLKDLFEAVKITKGKGDSLVTSLAFLAVKRIGNNTNLTLKDIQNLRVTDLDYLGEKVQELKLEGTIDTDIEITCENCKKDFKISLNVYDPSFFSPTKSSNNSTT